MQDTEEQASIIQAVRTTSSNILIDALAGTGKTRTILKSLEGIPQRSILMAAFNKAIAQELEARKPRLPRTHAMHIKTFHSLGLGIIKSSHPQLEVSKDATEELVTKVCVGRAVSFQTRRHINRLVRLLKETQVDPEPEPEEILQLASEHEVFGYKTTENDIEIAVDRTLAAYELSRDIANLTAIDFCDMVWLPIVCNLTPTSRYQAIVVDELQDISEPQMALLQHVALPTTRWIAVGDQRQAIYGWRGGMGDKAWKILTEQYNAETHWLTVTHRNAKLIVAAANRVLYERGDQAEHSLKARDDANDGTVTTIALEDLPKHFVGGPSDVVHTFVLSRLNDMLLKCALFLHRSQVRFQLIGGKDLLAPLFELLDAKLDLRSADLFNKSLVKWKGEQLARAEKLGSPSMEDRVKEQANMLAHALEATGFKPTHIKGLLAAVLADNKSGVWLMTVHKAKGLEAQRVFLLKQSFMRQTAISRSTTWTSDTPSGSHQEINLRLQQNVPIEELNIEYVAITRAKEHLVWVDMDPEAEQGIDAVEEARLGLDDETLEKSTIAELEAIFERAEREAQRLDKSKPQDAKVLTAYAGRALAILQRKIKETK